MKRGHLAAIVSAALLLAVFAPGLTGPFVLDDHVNLAPVWEWLRGARSFVDTAFGNSGPGGRPLAYLTLMANAWIGADASVGFKFFNILLHGANAFLVWLLARRCLSLAGRGPVDQLAVAVAAMWALHPMQVSSVLYVVQRMALLGAAAQLAAVLIYLQARTCTDPVRSRRLLFLGVPLVMAAGFFGKETALLSPLLCLATELTVLSGVARRREHAWFFVAWLVAPALAGAGWITGHPDWLARGYDGREFTLLQRLLTEPRILLDYAAGWFWPVAQALYRDGYVPLSSLAQAWPPMAVLACAVAAALAMRRRAALASFGVLWFLAAHALEAGPIALELYFEHRNYLPSLGLAFLVAALLPTRAAVPVLATAAVLLGALTMQRSYAWADLSRLLAAEAPPSGEISRRLQIDRAIHAASEQDAIARQEALLALDAGTAGDRAAAAIWRLVFACDIDKTVSVDQVDAAAHSPPSVLTHAHLSWLALVVRRAASHSCDGLDPQRGSMLLDAWQKGARQPLSGDARSRLTVMRHQLGEAP